MLLRCKSLRYQKHADVFFFLCSEADAAQCLSTWRDSLWLSAFWWLLGHLGPLGLISLPALLNLCAARRRLGRQLGRCVALAALGILMHCLLTLPSLVQEAAHWIRVLGRRGQPSGQISVDPLSARREREEYAAAADFVAFVLTRLLPELRLLYLPAGVMIVLPIRPSCREDAPEEQEGQYATISELSEERVFLESGESPYSSRRRLLEMQRRAMARNGELNVYPSAERRTRGGRRRGKSNNRSSVSLGGQGGGARLEEDEDEGEDGFDVVHGVVAAEIHQRLSRSRTTIV